MSRKEKFFWWKVIITVISFIAVILSKVLLIGVTCQIIILTQLFVKKSRMI